MWINCSEPSRSLARLFAHGICKKLIYSLDNFMYLLSYSSLNNFQFFPEFFLSNVRRWHIFLHEATRFSVAPIAHYTRRLTMLATVPLNWLFHVFPVKHLPFMSHLHDNQNDRFRKRVVFFMYENITQLT